jgi:hypothetical protein
MLVDKETVGRMGGPYFKVGKWDTVLWIMRFAEEEIPKAELASLHLEFFDDRNDGLPPRRVIGELSLGQPLSRPDLRLPRCAPDELERR